MLWRQCQQYCQRVNDSCGERALVEGVSSQVNTSERGLWFMIPRITLGPFTILPAPETPGEHQVESDPTVTSRQL